MPFTDIFIRRPVLAIVASLLLLLLGLQAASRLAIREFPKIQKSIIQISTTYPGASARTVQGFVTTPLQRYIASARGIEYMTSKSNPGESSIKVYARLGENSREILSEIIAKVNEARYELPKEIEDPVVSVYAMGDALMYIALLSDELSIEQTTDYLMRSVQPELSTIEGVGSASILGAKYFSMRIWLDPGRMAARGVTAEDVREAIRNENYISTTGETQGPWVVTSVDAKTDLSEPAEFSEIVVRQEGDHRVLLEDVAELELSSEEINFSAFSSGRRTIFFKIETTPDANPLDVAGRIRSIIPSLRAQLPADLDIFVDYDASIYIQEALTEVALTLAEAALIVILVIYLFLGSLRVVLIPIVAIPLSLIGVLFLIYLMGFSINLLTLLAMVIAIGLVVDDAIVVVENVHRYIEKGEAPFDAALKGARQVALPVVAMTITLAAVYAPIGFLGGLTGALFTEFALTLAGAVIVSGVVALTLSPMMCAHVLSDHDHQGRFSNWLDQAFDRVKVSYQRLLNGCLENRGATLLFGFSILVSLPFLFGMAQQELAPEEDTGDIMVLAKRPQYSNIDYIDRFLEELVTTWKEVPEITHAWQISSTSRIMGGLSLADWDERDRSQAEIRADLQAKLNHISGLGFFSFSPNPLPGSDSGLPIKFVVASTASYSEVNRVANELLQRARASGLFAFVTKELEFSRPELRVSIDRAKAARLGISMKSIGDTLSVMLGESEVSRFSMEGRSYKVIPQAAPGFRLTKEELEKYYIRTAHGDLIPLATLITLGQEVQPNSLTQYQQLNSTLIEAQPMPPHSLGEGLSFLKSNLAKIAPTGFRSGYEGESLRFIQESDSFLVLFAVSLIVIFLVLAAQFNGFRDPLVVLIGVPMSIFGAVIPLATGVVTLNIYTQIGLLTLIGLISKHGILIVDFANQLVGEGLDAKDAVLQAAALRLRPILMTTAATILGVYPLIAASGAGAASRFGIGVIITTGMGIGTLFTLFVLPTFYLPFRISRSTRPFQQGSGRERLDSGKNTEGLRT